MRFYNLKKLQLNLFWFLTFASFVEATIAATATEIRENEEYGNKIRPKSIEQWA
jgi:hypothetical protein